MKPDTFTLNMAGIQLFQDCKKYAIKDIFGSLVALLESEDITDDRVASSVIAHSYLPAIAATVIGGTVSVGVVPSKDNWLDFCGKVFDDVIQSLPKAKS